MRFALALLILACGSFARAEQSPPKPERPRPDRVQVAVTVDDLPAHGPPLPGVSRLAVVERLLAAFAAHKLPSVHGFVNGKLVDDDPASQVIVHRWVAAGQELGNHSWSHPSLNNTSLEVRALYEATHAPVRSGSALPYVLARERGLNVDPPVWARGLEAELNAVCRYQ